MAKTKQRGEHQNQIQLAWAIWFPYANMLSDKQYWMLRCGRKVKGFSGGRPLPEDTLLKVLELARKRYSHLPEGKPFALLYKGLWGAKFDDRWLLNEAERMLRRQGMKQAEVRERVEGAKSIGELLK